MLPKFSQQNKWIDVEVNVYDLDLVFLCVVVQIEPMDDGPSSNRFMRSYNRPVFQSHLLYPPPFLYHKQDLNFVLIVFF